jgi:hypothetical protein
MSVDRNSPEIPDSSTAGTFRPSPMQLSMMNLEYVVADLRHRLAETEAQRDRAIAALADSSRASFEAQEALRALLGKALAALRPFADYATWVLGDRPGAAVLLEDAGCRQKYAVRARHLKDARDLLLSTAEKETAGGLGNIISDLAGPVGSEAAGQTNSHEHMYAMLAKALGALEKTYFFQDINEALQLLQECASKVEGRENRNILHRASRHLLHQVPTDMNTGGRDCLASDAAQQALREREELLADRRRLDQRRITIGLREFVDVDLRAAIDAAMGGEAAG